MKQKIFLVLVISGIVLISGCVSKQDADKKPFNYSDMQPTLPLVKECCDKCIASGDSGPCTNIQQGRGPSGQDCDMLFNITSHGEDKKIFSVEDCKAIFVK